MIGRKLTGSARIEVPVSGLPQDVQTRNALFYTSRCCAEQHISVGDLHHI